MIYASLGIGSASLAGYIALNRINKKRESIWQQKNLKILKDQMEEK
jgi:hypothetical protein